MKRNKEKYQRSIIFAFRMYEVGQSEINMRRILKRVFPALETKYEEILKEAKKMFDESTRDDQMWGGY
jgi:hypothetical protein